VRHFGGPTSWGRFAAIHIARGKIKKHNRAIAIRGFSRQMQSNPSSLELRMSDLLNELQIRFYSQYVCGDFIVDFYLPGACGSKVIEVDGPRHDIPKQMRRDAHKDKILGHKGFKILRVKYWEFADIHQVKERIKDFVGMQERITALVS
jgi:very-short-patch-repair endonuclease